MLAIGKERKQKDSYIVDKKKDMKKTIENKEHKHYVK